VFLLLVAAVLFVVGMFLESNAAYIMLVPLLHPIALQYGIDPTHFAFLFVLNLIIGMMTPPVGVVLFASRDDRDQDGRARGLRTVHRLPCLALCLFFPPLVPGCRSWSVTDAAARPGSSAGASPHSAADTGREIEVALVRAGFSMGRRRSRCAASAWRAPATRPIPLP
jgi:hypothetical protein